MANASGSVFAKSGVADAVNLTFVPLPGGGSAACQQSDGVDACAIYAAGCIGGCTGASAATLGKFAGCFEGAPRNSARNSVPHFSTRPLLHRRLHRAQLLPGARAAVRHVVGPQPERVRRVQRRPERPRPPVGGGVARDGPRPARLPVHDDGRRPRQRGHRRPTRHRALLARRAGGVLRKARHVRARAPRHAPRRAPTHDGRGSKPAPLRGARASPRRTVGVARRRRVVALSILGIVRYFDAARARYRVTSSTSVRRRLAAKSHGEQNL